MQRAHRITLLLLAILFTVVMANAQQPTGSIEGTVEDQSGDRLENAIITITQQGTGRAITVPTNREGYFVARSLVPGKYTVKVDVTGFAAAIFTDVVVQIGQTSNVSPVLKVGTASEVVQVEGTAATLQVDTSRQTIDGVITAEKIEQLPVNGRNFLDLARLQPGVVTRDGNAIDPTKTNA